MEVRREDGGKKRRWSKKRREIQNLIWEILLKDYLNKWSDKQQGTGNNCSKQEYRVLYCCRGKDSLTAR